MQQANIQQRAGAVQHAATPTDCQQQQLRYTIAYVRLSVRYILYEIQRTAQQPVLELHDTSCTQASGPKELFFYHAQHLHAL